MWEENNVQFSYATFLQYFYYEISSSNRTRLLNIAAFSDKTVRKNNNNDVSWQFILDRIILVK